MNTKDTEKVVMQEVDKLQKIDVVQELKNNKTLSLLFKNLKISDREIFDNAIEFLDIIEQSQNEENRILKTNVVRDKNGHLQFLKLFSNNPKANYYKIINNTVFTDICEPDYEADIDSVIVSDDVKNLSVVLKNLDSLGSNFSNFVYISGPVVSGKTYVLSAISNYYALKDKKVAFLDLKKLFSTFLDLFTKKRKINFLTQEIMNIEVLMIDNFGFKNETQWFSDVIVEIIKYRASKNLLTFFASEKPLKVFNNENDINSLKQYKIISENCDFIVELKG